MKEVEVKVKCKMCESQFEYTHESREFCSKKCFEESEKKRRVVTDSTSWRDVELVAVANYQDAVEVGKREYNENSKCFTKNVKLTLTGESSEELYELLRHINSDCEDFDCKYCEEAEEDL